MLADSIIQIARSLIGTPFQHQGRLPGVALDCVGLIVVIARELGLPHFDRQDYAKNPHRGQLEEALKRQPCLERIETLEPGAVILTRISATPQHVGIFTGTSMIHAWAAAGKVCEHPADDKWKGRIVRVYRMKESQ